MSAFDKNKNIDEDENMFDFSKVTRGYKPKEVNNFILELKRSNANIIKNYEGKIADYQNENEMLQCEIAELKATLASRDRNEKAAIESADKAREKLKALQRDIAEIDALRKDAGDSKALAERLQKENEKLQKNFTIADADKKLLKEKLEAVKKEFSESKNAYKAQIEQIKSDFAQKAQDGAQAAAEKAAAANDDELQRVIGAYTIHLKKTRQIVESLQEQLDKADDIL